MRTRLLQSAHLPLLLVVLAAIGCGQDGPMAHGVARERSAEPAGDRPEEPEREAPALDREPAIPRERRAPAAAEPSFAPAAAPSREGWNDAQIEWLPYEAGLERARASGRPVCLVLSADWCPHCRNYSHVFEDPRIALRARELVMIRIDTDAQREIASRYAIDGGYVPRTYFLAPDGEPLPIDAQRPRYRYFFDEHDPASLLAGMDRALASL